LEQCYLDASNLNRVKAELKILALQNAKLATLLAMLQAPELDTTLDRKAQVRVVACVLSLVCLASLLPFTMDG
jgi:hypothetical protein